MQLRRLGSTGRDVSEVGFGAWAIGGSWGDVSDDERGQGRHRSGVDLRRSRRPLLAAQQSLGPCDELAHRERLGHVVVGAHAEADQHVGLVVAGGQHEHRHRTFRLDASAHLEPVQTREHDIQDDDVRTQRARHGDPAVAVESHLDTPALAGQPSGDRGGDGGFVLDDEDEDVRGGSR